MARHSHFAQWLENRFLDWQKQEGGRRTATEFAAWLEIGNATVNQWLTGQARPRPEFAFRLAKRLGLDVYTALGLPQPDPVLFELECNWERLTDDEKERIGQVLEKMNARQKSQARSKPASSLAQQR